MLVTHYKFNSSTLANSEYLTLAAHLRQLTHYKSTHKRTMTERPWPLRFRLTISIRLSMRTNRSLAAEGGCAP